MRCVVPGRLELPTSTLSVWRSNQLSYRTGFKLSAACAQLHSFSILENRNSEYKKKGSTLRRTSQKSLAPSITVCRTTLSRERERVSRKEVFQPHLPVRLPCYDLAPITCFTLGRPSRSRTSGAPGFHGLTGGVYKARERIHRAMADARLLANPASWGRVADPNPN